MVSVIFKEVVRSEVRLMCCSFCDLLVFLFCRLCDVVTLCLDSVYKTIIKLLIVCLYFIYSNNRIGRGVQNLVTVSDIGSELTSKVKNRKLSFRNLVFKNRLWQFGDIVSFTVHHIQGGPKK